MKNKLLLFGMLSVALVSCKKEEQKQDGPKKIPVVAAEVRNMTSYQSFPANIEGRVNNEVRAKIQGYITQVLVDEGQYVTKGQPLFRLETNVLTENESAARAGIGAARSSAAAAEANVAAAKAAVNAAMVEVDKIKPLVAKNIISNVQLQTAQASLARAQAQYQQAIAARQQATAGISQATATYKGVQANVDYSVIRAPISGYVGKLPLKVGSLVGPSDQQALTTVSDTNGVYAYFSMNETEYLNFLKNGYGATVPEKIKNMPMVELILANGSVYPEKGKIETVTGQIDAQTGTIQFRVGFPNPQKLLSNGNSGTVRIPKAFDQALVIPQSSTFDQQGIIYVYKVNKDSVQNEVVQIEESVDNFSIVKSGLKKGDLIVASGLGNIKNGDKIIPQKIKMDSLVQSLKPIQ